MFELFDIFSNKNQDNPTSVPQQKPVLVQPEKEYDFVEKYVLIDPKQVMAQYNLWSSSKMVPVAYERQQDSVSMFHECVLLPTKHFMGYLEELRKTPYEITSNPLTRTIYIVHLNNDNTMYIVPNLQNKAHPTIIMNNTVYQFPKVIHSGAKFGKSDIKTTLFYNMTPEIRRILIQTKKQLTK